ncbi:MULTISPECIES: short-chain fatty acid transporter [unclassified Salinicola]|uniref:short-chain fatty acid transporter n=1 Tax=unclassified Salinicola TaxID=2634022 RepID=UPI001A8DBD74|nr:MULTISPECIES: TIGR00366 family protein [unclassified Salinicola]MCE3027293.1 TIGR00366 family protein [Salinicola sp. DM10]WIX33945.1 TIGR00366 family protein [Salinicola sp. JS01]
MQFLTRLCLRFVQTCLPNAMLLAIALSAVVFVLGMTVEGQSAYTMFEAWGEGFSNLYKFAMQMCLILLTGFVIAKTPSVARMIDRLAAFPKSPAQAVGIIAVVSMVTFYINWGFGMIVGAFLAREMGRRVAGLHFPLAVAAAYSGEIIRGTTASIPLLMASEGNFMQDVVGVVPITETLYSWWNIVLSLVLLGLLYIVFTRVKPHGEIKPFKGEALDDDNAPVDTRGMPWAEKLEHYRLPNLLLALLPLGYLAINFHQLGFTLSLNLVILIFLAIGLLLQPSPASFGKAVKEGVLSCRGIIMQFPLYAGIAGMVKVSGLADSMAGWFVEIANVHTFPILTFISAGLINIFIPSGGGQWAIQGPIMLNAAQTLGADIPQTIMAFTWGDAWTNQMQPFWALPLLGVAGLSARDIMGYCVMWTLICGATIMGLFVLLSLM